MSAGENLGSLLKINRVKKDKEMMLIKESKIMIFHQTKWGVGLGGGVDNIVPLFFVHPSLRWRRISQHLWISNL